MLLIWSKIQAQNATVYVRDITNFWNAYDSVQLENNEKLQLDYIQKLYVDKGTAGLIEFMNLRGGSSEKWLDMIKKDRDRLEKICSYTMSVLEQKAIIEQKLARMKELYSNFSGGDIFFTVGINNSGGTVQGKHVLIRSEVTANKKPDWAVMIVLHEFVHTMQKTNNNHLLANCILEGMADFVAELAYGRNCQNIIHMDTLLLD